jgi:hypothetical protein
MSAPGQRDRPRPTADPATIQATIGIKVHTSARTDSPNIDVTHGGDSEMDNDHLAQRAQFSSTMCLPKE